MRTLKFLVMGQIMKPDPSCDFDDLVPGTERYVRAEFLFSSDWDGYVKVAAFYNALGIEYKPELLTDGMTCIIPAEALKRRAFKIRIVGKKGDSRLTTNKVEVTQNGGRA